MEDRSPAKVSRATLGRLLRLARPEWRRLLAGTVFLIIGSSTSLLYPQAMRYIIDVALVQGRPELVDRAALALAVIFLVQGAAIGLRYVMFSVAGEKVVATLREDLYRSILRQEVAFFDERRTGELTNRLGSDTTVLQSAVSANISMALRNGVGVLGGLGFLLYTSPTLTLLMLLVVPPVALGAVAYGRRVRKLSRDVQDALAGANEVAEESISGIRTVRSFTAEESEGLRYGKEVNHSFELGRSRAITAGTFMGAASFAAFMAAAVVLWYGGRLVISGGLSVGGLTSFLIYTLVVAFSLGALSDLWADLMKASGAAERVFELLDREPSIPSSGGLTLPRVDGKLELQAVAFSYPTRRDAPVLRGVDLSLRAGEIVALVGPSGAGKSTIASLLARLYDPDSGRILLDGHDLRELDPRWLRQQVGTVAQEPILFSTSISENIGYGRPGASEAEIESASRTANADEFVRRFPGGYGTLVGERGVQLSGGQKQRVAIARAVLKDPRILVLDEATSALDAESEHLVKEALDRLMRGRTTLIIAHRLSTVIDADRVLVLDGGQVVQSGNHRALMGEEGLYKRLIERQFVSA
ncbi:MAG: ABC transporter ATP-binding protein [Myxococcaceae bacterium]